MADGLGFRWGQDRFQPNFGFRWKGCPTTERLVRVHHPLGFRFAEDPTDTLTAAEAPAHPSGFRFREPPSHATPVNDRPPGFSWGVNRARRGTSFRWKT